METTQVRSKDDGRYHVTRDSSQGLDLRVAAGREGFESLLALRYQQKKGKYRIAKNAEFEKWFFKETRDSAQFMAYFVACAFKGATVVGPGGREWRGVFGIVGTGAPPPAQPTPIGPDEQKWLSACLLAHANARHLSQHISLRGAQQAFELTPGERFAMGHPEGVFFGNLWDLSVKGGVRYAMSLNLPPNCDDRPMKWWPPNVALGRTVDFDRSDVAEYLGRCQGLEGHFGGSAAGPDPVHRSEWVCPEGDFGAACRAGDAKAFHPVFVYGPRFATAYHHGSQFDAAPVQLEGDFGREACSPDRPRPTADRRGFDRRTACVVGYDPLQGRAGVCGWESTWPIDGPGGADVLPARSFTLSDAKKSVTAVRRATSQEEVDFGEGADFTARIRVRVEQKGKGDAVVVVTSAGERAVGWDALAQGAKYRGFTWLDVYPVKPTFTGGLPELRIKLRGTPSSGGLRFDAIGFIPGQPSCCRGASGPGWCAGSAPLKAGLCHQPLVERSAAAVGTGRR